MSVKKACIYVRVSSMDGKQTTDRQTYELKQILLSEGYKDGEIHVYSEMISGFTRLEDRPVLSELLTEIRKNPHTFDSLCIHEISRLGRDPITTRNIIDELTTLGVNVYIKNLNLNTITNGERNWITNILLTILMEYSKLETDLFKERSKSGLLKSARLGRMGGGIFHTYGYRKDENKMMVIDEEESKVIEKIFDLYLMGNGIKVISNILNEEGIPTRLSKSFPEKTFNFGREKKGKDFKWSDKQVHDILRNSSYIGKRQFSGIEVNCPQIIDNDQFETCNNLLKSKSVKGNNIYTFILKDLIKCGSCGRNYYGRYKIGRKGEKVYKCSSTRFKGGSCGSLGINITFLESVLLQFTNIIMTFIHEVNISSDTKAHLQNDVLKVTEIIKSTQYEINKEKRKIERLLSLYEDGELDKSEFITRRNGYLSILEKKELSLKKTKTHLKQLNAELTQESEVEFLEYNKNRPLLLSKLSKIYDLILVGGNNSDNIQLMLTIPLLGGNSLRCELIMFPKNLMKKVKKYEYRINTVILHFKNKSHFVIEDLYNAGKLPLKSHGTICYSKDEIKSINRKITNNSTESGMDRLEQIINAFTTNATFDFSKAFVIEESQLVNMELD